MLKPTRQTTVRCSRSTNEDGVHDRNMPISGGELLEISGEVETQLSEQLHNTQELRLPLEQRVEAYFNDARCGVPESLLPPEDDPVFESLDIELDQNIRFQLNQAVRKGVIEPNDWNRQRLFAAGCRGNSLMKFGCRQER